VDGTTRKKGPDGLVEGIRKKPESWMAVLDFVEPCCLCPLSFWSVFFSLQTTAHFLFFFSPTDLMFFKDRWVNQDFFEWGTSLPLELEIESKWLETER
jgi:hypothetical protein